MAESLTTGQNVTDLAEFEVGLFGYNLIKRWALSSTGGGLPEVSARPFATWLHDSWNDFDDGSGTMTNEVILKGALAFWKGE